MSWIQKLYETYDACAGNENIQDIDELCPVGYSVQNAQIEIVINDIGEFRRASLVQKENNPKTLIPVTEESAGRTSGESPHALCDSLQYCAGDYPKYGGVRKSYFDSYLGQLEKWTKSEYSHQKARAVLSYVKKQTVIKDLINHGLLSISNGVLTIEVKDEPPTTSSPIMKLLTADDKGQKDQAKVFIRWSVENANELCTQTWKDTTLFESWRKYCDSLESKSGFCYVTGENVGLAQKHPAKLRNGKDGAKIISSNDASGYTFLGRFTDAPQAAGVSAEVTQKAHSALRWLIGRKQAFKSGDQIFVSWAVTGKEIPDPCANTLDFLGQTEDTVSSHRTVIGDVGQSFALRLNRKIAGYKANTMDTEAIVVMGLDSATPGRMAITFYRELQGSEFLERIEQWHLAYAWFQNYGQNSNFIGAPSPRDIAWAAFGKKIEKETDSKLMKSSVSRIFPSIIDGAKLPRDFVESAIYQTTNRMGFRDPKQKRAVSEQHWEKCLGITCSLYRGINKERGYKMALEEDRKTRDYLYGRLLALAEQLESTALFYAKEKRDTLAARLMQRFADRPASTWRTLETSLAPYKSRINAKTPGLLTGYSELLDKIFSLFTPNDFVSDDRLSGEYLLGYHCQRKWLREHKREKGQWVLRNLEEAEMDITGEEN